MGTPAHVAEGDVITQGLEWLRRNRRSAMATAAVAVIVGGGAWFTVSARARKEAFAAGALRDAQAAVQAGNTPLAMNDLSRLITTYRGTTAAAEGAILLGQLRLAHGQADSAVTELRSFAESGPQARYQAAAYNLLGAALEQTGRMAEAGEAYAEAGASWPYTYLKAQALLDAGRTYRAAGDTGRAAQSYLQIVRDFASTPSAVEARLRLAELRRGDVPTP